VFRKERNVAGTGSFHIFRWQKWGGGGGSHSVGTDRKVQSLSLSPGRSQVDASSPFHLRPETDPVSAALRSNVSVRAEGTNAGSE
jgi:hypothetical protein